MQKEYKRKLIRVRFIVVRTASTVWHNVKKASSEFRPLRAKA
jgi:hypothetical protein